MPFIRIYVTLVLLIFAFNTKGQQMEMLKFDSLTAQVHQNNDSLYILNFWASWCKPCIEELPFFERINDEYREKPVSMILVNLDFHSKVESSVKPFLVNRKIKSKVVHITDTDPNEWINKIDERWSGAIPATVIYKNGEPVFFKEGSMTYEELKSVLDNELN